MDPLIAESKSNYSRSTIIDYGREPFSFLAGSPWGFLGATLRKRKGSGAVLPLMEMEMEFLELSW